LSNLIKIGASQVSGIDQNVADRTQLGHALKSFPSKALREHGDHLCCFYWLGDKGRVWQAIRILFLGACIYFFDFTIWAVFPLHRRWEMIIKKTLGKEG
jgi:hypothetical protein